MSQGILETILAGTTANAQSLESLHTKIDQLAAAMGKTLTVTPPSTVGAVTEQATTTQTQQTVDASASEQKTVQTASENVELDADGVPWDVRIHSGKNASEGKRTKGGQGIWQRRRKIDDELYESVTKELKAAYGSNNTTADIPPPSTGASTPPPPAASSTTPPPPATNGTPPPPATGSTTPPPPADDPNVAARKAATEAMNKLTKDRNVILDVLIMHFEETYGVDNFSLINSDNYGTLTTELGDWAARVETAQGTVNAITRLYEADPSVVIPYIDQVINQFQYISAGVAETSKTVGQVPYSQIANLNNGLNELFINCRKAAGKE